MITYHIDLKFIQPVLGTASSNPRIHEQFIASKAPDAPSLKEEVEALGVEAVEQRGTTVFPKTKDGKPFLWDYMIKGFMKDACKSMRDADGSTSAGLVAYKTKIDTLIFPSPRNIRLNMPEGSGIRVLERPLRIDTPPYPRVALAASEMLDAGTTCSFDVKMLAAKTKGTKSKPGVSLTKCLIEWFSYGQLRGLCQWRNAGFGAFVCTITNKDTGEVVFDNMR